MGIAAAPAMNSAMMASVAALRAAGEMLEQTAQIAAIAASTPESRAPLPYTRLLDQLA